MPHPPVLTVRIFLPFACGYFLSYLYRSVNAVIAPDLARDLGLDATGLGLLTSAYFLSFAAFQLPLGVLLDRFGPRRVEAVLLLLAALGALVFSQAATTTGLFVGRALIGLGVSACLMGAFKAFVLWFPADGLPRANGLHMISGGLGALAATTPVEWALRITDWRGVFLALAGLTLLTAAGLFLVVPERAATPEREHLGQQFRGVWTIFTSPIFWRIAPWSVASQAAFLALGGLWAGPWLRDVAGFGRSSVAWTLAGVALAMVAGYPFFGALAQRLDRRGVPPLALALAGMALFLLVQAGLAAGWAPMAVPLWLLFGFLGTSTVLPYAILSRHFPVHLAGRANTALNLLVFVAAFAAQWGIGAVIGRWPLTASGGYDNSGYAVAFALPLAVQGIAVLTCGWGRGSKGAEKEGTGA